MATRLLIIHKQLVFAVTLKQALEQTGGFAVHPFTKAEAAFDFLRDHPQDIALLDFNLPGRSGIRVIQQLRTLQPDIVVIVTPQLSDGDMRNFGVQASLNSPFTARDLLPLLQNVLDEAPSDNLATSAQPPMGGQMTTSNLGEQKRIKRQQMGTTQNLGDSAPAQTNEPSQTNILITPDVNEDEKPQTKELTDNPLKRHRKAVQDSDLESGTNKPTTQPLTDDSPPIAPNTGKVDPFQTRNLDEMDLNDLRPPKTKPLGDEAPSDTPNTNRFQTRILDDDEDSEPKVDTRILPDSPSIPEIDSLTTRRLENNQSYEEDGPQTRDLGGQHAGNDPFGTRPIGEAPTPPIPPEFSSLDQVLQSFGMEEPPADDMDTPAVPTKDSDALRQFIATNSGEFDAESFDDVLGAIEPDIEDAPKKQRQVDFEGLVKSMQRDEPQNRLPDRQQQQLLDFVLTSGMDSVLKEIEKTKTGLLPKVQNTPPNEPPRSPTPKRSGAQSSFRKLAEEEPPLPTLEENGTVSDLLVGISDSNFRDVLALLNEGGDSQQSRPQSKPSAQSSDKQSDTGYFEDFLQSTNPDSDSVPVTRTPATTRENYDFNFDYDEDDGATVAGVVLKSTQENTLTPGEFSLDQLMSDINNRLTTHKLKVRPLPSWDMDTTAFHAAVTDAEDNPNTTSSPGSKRMPGEPSFLPEMFPPDEIIPRELPQMETDAEVAEVWTTQASEPSLEQIETVDTDGETRIEPGYFDETLAGEPATIDSDLFSGILEDSAAIDDQPRYDDQAESSENQFAFDWNEPEVTVESASIDDSFGALETEEGIEPPAVDDWNLQQDEPQTAPHIEDIDSFNRDEDIRAENAVYDDNKWEASDFTAANDLTVESVSDAWDLPAPAEAEPIPPVETHAAALTEEARIAQLALNLTQVSLETSAEGTILTRQNQIIALAGHLSQEDIIELQNTIHNDWGTGGDGGRLRFITLPSSNKEYMLYSTGTEDDLILSMIFAGTTPLRIIRQQGQRLVKALGEVPETQPAPAIVSTPRREIQSSIEESLEPNAYVWLVRDPEQRLSDAVAHSINAGLMTQLNEMNWKIEQLKVQEEYIYLLANVPSETPSYAVIRELKQRAATIAQKQDSNLENQDLWADSYLVLSPGRELAPDEIQEFVDFQRMM
ncbi:MAG: response regulator [Anaerolineaceae bacterium]|nr:response regulator [Anaerolineaceae bacterium]